MNLLNITMEFSLALPLEFIIALRLFYNNSLTAKVENDRDLYPWSSYNLYIKKSKK